MIASITPGPNNVMLTASGMNFGYRRSLPHILGIMSGFLTLIILATLGVGAVYKTFPAAEILLKIMGSAYLLYLSIRIAMAGKLGVKEKAKETGKPLTFIEAFAFQFINPKGVVFSMTLIAILPAELSLLERCIAVTVSTLITAAVSTHVWTLFGQMIAGLFRTPRTRNIINLILAGLLMATIPLMIFA